MKKIGSWFKFVWRNIKGILTIREWMITGVTFLLSGLLVSSIFWYDSDDGLDDMVFEHLGYNLKVYTDEGIALRPFHTYYQVLYESIHDQSERDRVLEIFSNEVPPLHKIADRNNQFYIDDDAPELGLMTTIRDINESYGSGAWVEVSPDLYRILEIGKNLTISTNSNYNFFVGKLSDYWNGLLEDFSYPFTYEQMDPYYDDEERAYLEMIHSYVPLTQEDIDATLELKQDNGYFVRFNEFNDAPLGMLQITLGGIAKGYANDVISEKLAAEDLVHGFINGGESSITTLGKRYGDIAWPFKMTSPSPDVDSAYNINRTGAFSISTSGGYQGVRIPIEDELVWRHHIIDPWTGYPSQQQLHVNVMSHDVPSSVLDALSTAFMNMSRSEAMDVRQDYVDQGYELEIAWIEIATDQTLDVFYTEGFSPYLGENPENNYNLYEKLT